VFRVLGIYNFEYPTRFSHLYQHKYSKILIGRPVFFLGLGIADSDDDEDDAADMMDDDDAIFLPEKSANNRRIQPLIPDDFGKQTLFLLNCKR
jgi:hypothetical protein